MEGENGEDISKCGVYYFKPFCWLDIIVENIGMGTYSAILNGK